MMITVEFHKFLHNMT